MSDIPAFPTQFFNADKQAWIFDKGMTLRDYFATQAMQGFMGSSWNNKTFELIATKAYQLSDEMMKARK